jgi:hypothetical protein
MEGTRRIDEWLEIQKVLPPDDVLLSLVKVPRTSNDEIKLTLDEFKVLALINGERTLPDLINLSPMGEFVTCRAIYKLVTSKLVEVVGKREEKVEKEDEEEVLLRIIFNLYNSSVHRIRSLFDEKLGEENSCFGAFAAQYRSGLLHYFPGVDPKSDLMPSFEKFLTAVLAIPAPVRFYTLMSQLQQMLTEELEFVFQLLGVGVFREATSAVKRDMAEPLATRRELVKRYGLEESFYSAIRRADRVVKTVRG